MTNLSRLCMELASGPLNWPDKSTLQDDYQLALTLRQARSKSSALASSTVQAVGQYSLGAAMSPMTSPQLHRECLHMLAHLCSIDSPNLDVGEACKLAMKVARSQGSEREYEDEDQFFSVYRSAVDALKDDWELVRLSAINLTSSLLPQGGAAPLADLALTPALFGSQFGESLSLVDDCFQRVCNVMGDPSARVRAAAVQTLAAGGDCGEPFSWSDVRSAEDLSPAAAVADCLKSDF
eukprot:gene27146-2380_t